MNQAAIVMIAAGMPMLIVSVLILAYFGVRDALDDIARDPHQRSLSVIGLQWAASVGAGLIVAGLVVAGLA